MNRFFIISALILFVNNVLFAQSQKDTLKTQQVTVIKSYTPSLSDDILIPSFPNVNDSVYIKINKLKFNILEN